MPTAEYRRCSMDECDAKHEARGLCKRHYRAWQRKYQPEVERRHDQDRRSRPARAAQERTRNQRRRQYINTWIRQYHARLDTNIVEFVDPQEVFRRDGYRCQICGQKTTGSFPALTAPTVDHIIPVSKGGEHSYRNTQCACFSCNCRKGNRPANDQLRLL